jgi:hypothetical protein
MRAQDMRAVMIRLTPVEHALLQTILKDEALNLQSFFRQAAMRKIQQRAHAVAASEEEGARTHENASPGAESR